nr:rhodanese-like domain-containing protein [Enterococcus timonensis]
MRSITVVNIILIAVILVWGGYDLYLRLMGKMSATTIEEDEFKEGMRKAQVLDLREKDEFRGGHILGARNMPYTQFKTLMTSIRRDQPIYLYDTKKTLSIRAAFKLKKAGFENIYILKGGFRNWTGKVKQG